ncbi:hypothetical protein SAZ10_24325 [Mesorhizobium sp. BAC0120]|uniref:hypothetical protein n=1 Tax=Mesorhizobium sp. BAC0120 TaxID=3090670 RepID=UPI00298D3AF9|nr:hypothetical protein [Mesorhizobium sp. BAC0120]MDW6024886.1 hypothetical protein [Mesorhizobium sp. BAC0120]
MLTKIGVTVTLIIGVLTIAHTLLRPPSLKGRTVIKAAEASPSTTLGWFALTPHSAPAREELETRH